MPSLANRGWDRLEQRVADHFVRVGVSQAPEFDQCWHLVGLELGHSIEEGVGCRRIGGVERTRDATQMLDAVLARRHRFLEGYAVGHGAGNGQAPKTGPLNQGEIGVAWETSLNIDEIDAEVFFETIVGGAGFVGAADKEHRLFGIVRRQAIDRGAARFDVRSEQLVRLDLFAPAVDLCEVAAHVAEARNAPGQEHRELVVFVPEVDVHVPQAGDDVAVVPVDDLCAARGAGAGGDGTDVVAVDQD